MPFAWIAGIAFFIWLGMQVRQVEYGDHAIQRWLARRRAFVDIALPRKQGDNDCFEYLADLVFARHVTNVAVKVEVYRAYVMGWGDRWVWQRLCHTSPIKRVTCNKGDRESVKLIALKPKSEVVETPNAFKPNSLLPRSTNERGMFLAKVTVTAHGLEPISVSAAFLWRAKELLPLPPKMPTHEEGDANEFCEKECILWVTK